MRETYQKDSDKTTEGRLTTYEAAHEERGKSPCRSGLNLCSKRRFFFGRGKEVFLSEITHTPTIHEAEMMRLTEMQRLISNCNPNILPLPIPCRKRHLKDLEYGNRKMLPNETWHKYACFDFREAPRRGASNSQEKK